MTENQDFSSNKNIFLALLCLLCSLLVFANQEPISISDSLLLKIATAQDEQEKVNYLIDLSEYYINKDNQKGILYANEAMQMAKEYHLKKEEIFSYLLISRFHIDKGEFLEANNLIQKAIQKNEDLKDSLIYAQSYYSQALLFIHLDEYDKAADLCYQALRVYDNRKDLLGQAKVLNLIAAIYSSQLRFDKALEYSLKSLDIKSRLYDSINIAGDLSNIASSHMQQGNYQQAESYLERAIEINQKYNQKNWLAINYQNLASCYQWQNKIKKAEVYIFKSLDLYKQINNKLNETGIYIQLAKYYYNQEDYHHAKEYYHLALDMALENQYLSDLTFAYHGLYKIAEIDKDYKSALDYFTAYQSISDSLAKRESFNSLASLEIQYAMEQKQNELEFEKQRNIAKTQEKNLYMVILSISLFATLIVIVLLLLRYRIKIRYSKIKQQKLEDELDFKNKELTANVMSLMKKNEMLSEITDHLIEVEEKAVKEETKSALKRIALDIEKSTQVKIWEEFEIRFKQVHSDFYEKLINQFPELSPNEQRLCAFLRLNLSSKEISAITGRNPRSIEMARFRLRKKLGISSQDINLITFISKI